MINLGIFKVLEVMIKLLDGRRALKTSSQEFFQSNKFYTFFFFFSSTTRKKQRATLSAILSSKMSPSRAMLSSSGSHVLNEHTVNIATILQ